ncbi:MAG: aldo/keto reductase [Polyangiaceae bacterium]|nr:aldo/keto reductase [Polyangiaceae bacterium]
MKSRALGATGVRLPEVMLGTWGLSGDAYGAVTEAEQDRVIERAYRLGIRGFDVADSYAHGGMEERLGKRLADKSDSFIVTKIGTDRTASPVKRFDRGFLLAQVDACLERQERDVLDCVLLHNPSAAALQRGEATDAMKELVDTGKLKHWGVSVGSAAIGEAALDQDAPILMLAHNAFMDRDLAILRERVIEKRTGVLARSVLSHGLLCGQWPPHKEFPATDHRSARWTPDELRRRTGQLEALRALIGDDVLTMRSSALRYVLADPQISAMVIGPRDCTQLDQLVRESGRGAPYLDEQRLKRFANRLMDVGVTR